MKKLLLIVFKVLEVAAYMAVCYLISSLPCWNWLYDWMGSIDIYWIYILGATILVIWIVAFCSIFKDWINLNKKWVDKILKK